MKRYSGRNEGIRVLWDFVCNAIEVPGAPKKNTTSGSKPDSRKPKNGRAQKRKKRDDK